MATEEDTDAPFVPPDAGRTPFLIAGLAASAGGLEALSTLLRALPERPGLGLVLVLHLAPDRASGISGVLSRTTSMPVHEAAQGMPVEPDHVYIIPPNTEMTLRHGSLSLRPRSDSANPHKPADAFLVSLARDQGRRAVGVVLSGADRDGTRGLQAIKDAGGSTFAQDETARVSGMPESSIASGAVDFVGSPEVIARELVRLAREPIELEPSEDAVLDTDTPPEASLGEEHLREILALLHESTGADFSAYKANTVRRRILRRMALHRIHLASEFVDLLREKPGERQALHNDILIHVTRFFRDPEAFRVLEERAIPQLIERTDRSLRQPIRVWVPGCATGEEVYSIAISLLEGLGHADEGTLSLQVFGTDLSATAIEKARLGVYPLDIAADVPAERLKRFFVPVDSGFQVRKIVRDACVFATHDLSRDPPFSRMDLISCRNVLIYMSGPLQKRVLPLLHYGLNPRGFLLLGPAEALGSFSDLFVPIEKRWSLYQRAEGSTQRSIPYDPALRPTERAAPSKHVPVGVPPDQSLGREADLLLQSYAPPGVITDEHLDVLRFVGRTSPYLEPNSGRPTVHLLSMAADGLRAAIEDTVRRAQQTDAPAEARAYLERERREITVRVSPLGIAPDPRGFLVLFEDPDQVRHSPSLLQPPGTPDEMALVLSRARHELAALRLQLQSMTEGHQAAQEELQSANEEVLSSNEELQSTNEELQTSKEEVDSTNEELSTLNDELHARVSDLTRLNDDWTNVLASVQIPIVILNASLRIRSFTTPAGAIFRVIGTDVGRPLTDINIALRIPDLRALLNQVLDSLQPTMREVQDESDRWYQLRVRPYRTAENRIEGLILALIDIDEMKRAADAVAHARDYAEAIIATVRRPLLILDANLRVRTANPAFYRTFAVSPEQSEGRVLYELGNRQWDIPALRRHLEEVIPRDQHFDDFEVEHVFPAIGRRIMRMNGRRVEGKQGAEEQILIAIDDVTHERDQERGFIKRDRELVEADARKNEFLAMLAHELRNPLAPIVHAGSLLRRPQGQNPKVIERSADIIVRQSAHMTRLIEDLLDVARITRGKVTLQRQRVALQVIAESAAEAARPAMEARRHAFEVSLPLEAVEVDGDPARLSQIVSNLLQNAAKYTNPGGQVALTVEREAQSAVLRVRDNGNGIPATLLPHIFELFSQADRDLDRASGGLGIGLTVARSLVEMHDGTIEARSAGPGEGSEFIVRLPLRDDGFDQRPHLAESAEGSASTSAIHHPKRVLLIEDNEDAADVLVELLRQWGHDVRAVSEGRSALTMAREFQPELVLLDIGLPGMNGYDVARELRRVPGLEDSLVVAMSGYGQAEDQQRSRAAGVDRHLVKPVNVDVLEALLLERRR